MFCLTEPEIIWIWILQEESCGTDDTRMKINYSWTSNCFSAGCATPGVLQSSSFPSLPFCSFSGFLIFGLPSGCDPGLCSLIYIFYRSVRQNYHFGHHWIKLHLCKATSFSLDKRNPRKGRPKIQWVWQASWDWIRRKGWLVKSTTSQLWEKRGGIFPTFWRDIFHKMIVCQHSS